MKRQKVGPDSIVQAVKVLEAGGTVIFPTETVYGIGVLYNNEKALKRLFETKKRPADKPLQILISDPGQLDDLAAEISPAARDLARKYWPGPLTLVLKKKPGLSYLITSSGPTVGIRMPDSRFILDLLKKTGPLAASSANLSGQPDPASADGVKIEADLLIDGGRCRTGQASTVIDASVDPPLILRQGTIKI